MAVQCTGVRPFVAKATCPKAARTVLVVRAQKPAAIKCVELGPLWPAGTLAGR